jgi:psp operon transcriptional activator
LFRAQETDVPIEQIIVNPFASGYRAAAVTDDETPSHERPVAHATEWPIDLKAVMTSSERTWLTRALAKSGHRQKEAATLLGVNYNQIRSLVRKHGLMTRPSRTAPERGESDNTADIPLYRN